MTKFERELTKKGVKLIAGTDEVGRGCIAGPLVAAAVILPTNYVNPMIQDSKLTHKNKRTMISDIIKKDAIAYSIIFIDSKIVDDINPKQASRLGMKRAIESLSIKPEHVLIDFEKLDISIESTSIVKGDSNSITIAAASILAKVARDEYMKNLGKEYPQYGFESHMGYGTKQHLEALKKYGIIECHRVSYKPIKSIIS